MIFSIGISDTDLTRRFHKRSTARSKTPCLRRYSAKRILEIFQYVCEPFYAVPRRSHFVRYLHSWPFQAFRDDLCEICGLTALFIGVTASLCPAKKYHYSPSHSFDLHGCRQHLRAIAKAVKDAGGEVK